MFRYQMHGMTPAQEDGSRQPNQEVASLVASSKAADTGFDTNACVGIHTRRNISRPLASAPRFRRVRGRDAWRALQQRRYVSYFEWQRRIAETSGPGSPIVATKRAKPASDMFLT